jgi:hypothetical protein
MSVDSQTDIAPPWVPAPELEVVGAGHVAFAATPTMRFEALVREPRGIPIQSIALTVQVMIDPARRGYDPETRRRLAELFGPPEHWTPSTSGLAWARVTTTVPGFGPGDGSEAGETQFPLDVPCTYDLELAAAKYFYALPDGFVPLSFHFNGNVFYHAADDGRLQMTPISWSTSAQYQMPVAAWQAMIAEHYPGGGWIRVADDTLATLHDARAQRGHATFDALLSELLAGEGS